MTKSVAKLFSGLHSSAMSACKNTTPQSLRPWRALVFPLKLILVVSICYYQFTQLINLMWVGTSIELNETISSVALNDLERVLREIGAQQEAFQLPLMTREETEQDLLQQGKTAAKFHLTNNINPPLVERLPNVMIIGAQKAGTTSIAKWLFAKQRRVCKPHVFPGEPDYYSKEVQFFNDPSRYSLGLHFYANRFNFCNGRKYRLDATPNYLSYPGAIHKAYTQAGEEAVSRLKIIVILREPVARDMSWYNHIVNTYNIFKSNGKPQPNYIKPVIKSDGGVLNYTEYVEQVSLVRCSLSREEGGPEHCWGRYVEYLREWFALFDRKQILVLSYDELKENDNLIKERVRQFTELDKAKREGKIQMLNTNNGKLKVSKASCVAKEKLESVFMGLNEELYSLLEKYPGPSMEQRPFPKFKSAPCE